MSSSRGPSDARRLTDNLRAGSEPGQPYAIKGQVHEQQETLQLVLEGAVLRQRFLGDGRTHTVAVYYRDDVINLMAYAGAEPDTSDYLLAAKGSVIGIGSRCRSRGNQGHGRASGRRGPLGLPRTRDRA